MIASTDRWGPFAGDLTITECVARLRCLRAIVHLSTGPRGRALVEILHQAERDPDFLEPALAALDRLDALDKRRIWASYATLNRPCPEAPSC